MSWRLLHDVPPNLRFNGEVLAGELVGSRSSRQKGKGVEWREMLSFFHLVASPTSFAYFTYPTSRAVPLADQSRPRE